MSAIKALLSKNANYIYHMLSVSKCGYDNIYGEKYRTYHDKVDLQTLKKWDEYITVRGGEHCGELYGICVSIPSSFDDEVLIEYFSTLLHLFETQNLNSNYFQYKHIYKLAFSRFNIPITRDGLEEFLNSLTPLKGAIIDISRVMIDNYNIYTEKIWKISKNELQEGVYRLNNILSKKNITSQWEKILGYKYKHGNFFAVLCNSIENGPQAIDISHNKDVFAVPKDYTKAVNLISHEFGIYLLKDILSNTNAFQDLFSIIVLLWVVLMTLIGIGLISILIFISHCMMVILR